MLLTLARMAYVIGGFHLAGQYSVAMDSEDCAVCPPGTWSDTEGATLPSDCFACDSNTYSNETAGASTCTDCPAGAITVGSDRTACECEVGGRAINQHLIASMAFTLPPYTAVCGLPRRGSPRCMALKCVWYDWRGQKLNTTYTPTDCPAADPTILERLGFGGKVRGGGVQCNGHKHAI